MNILSSSFTCMFSSTVIISSAGHRIPASFHLSDGTGFDKVLTISRSHEIPYQVGSLCL